MTELLAEIEAFLSKHAMHATGFGIAAARDPSLVFDLKEGRKLRPYMVQWLRDWMTAYENGEPLSASQRKSRRPVPTNWRARQKASQARAAAAQ